jgi:exo-beta-1,3-glucanase (GH17 family)
MFYIRITYVLFFYSRPNGNIPSQDNSSPQLNDSMSQVANTKSNSSSNHSSNNESNSQSGKRKFSLSQYKEHKRTKSNDTIQNCTGDVDMRINTTEDLRVRIQTFPNTLKSIFSLQNSPPTAMDSDSSIVPNDQPVVSPKSKDISKGI